MSANLNITKLKLGQSSNPAQNFFISTPTPEDGTLTIEREDGTDVMNVDAVGNVTFPSAPRGIILKVNTTTNQAVPIGNTTILYPNIEVNTEAGWNASTGEFTVQKAGLYMISTINRFQYGSVGGELTGGGEATGVGSILGAGRVISMLAANWAGWINAHVTAWCPVGTVLRTRYYSEQAASLIGAGASNNTMTIARIG